VIWICSYCLRKWETEGRETDDDIDTHEHVLYLVLLYIGPVIRSSPNNGGHAVLEPKSGTGEVERRRPRRRRL
jgi:hypothetical protein